MTSAPMFKRAALALAATALFAAPARAQLSDVGGTNLIVPEPVLVGNDACYDPNNQAYLLLGAQGNVVGAFVNTAGGKVSAFGIGSANLGAPYGHYPRCVYSPDLNNGNGGFLVTWHQDDAGILYVHSVVVTYPSGPVSGSERVVSDGTEGGSNAGNGAAMAYSPTMHQIFVAWTTALWTTQGRFVDAATGAAVSPVKDYVTVSGGGSREPAVAWNATSGEFGLATAGWSASSEFVSFRLVATNGLAGSPSTFGFTTTGTYQAEVVVNGSGDFVVGWTAGGAQAWSTEFDPNGNSLNSGRLISTRIGTTTSLGFAFNPVSGTILAVGEEAANSGGNVAGVELDSGGTALAATIELTNGASASLAPRVAARTDARDFAISLAFNQNSLADQIVTTGSTGGSAGPQPLRVSLSSNHTFPMPSGTSVTWTASGTGGTAPLQYQFLEYTTSGGWSVGQAYSTANTFTWTPPQGIDAMQVWVRNAGSTNAYDAWTGSDLFTVTPPTATLTSFTANHTFPIVAGTTVTWTAVASALSGAVEYEFLEYTSGTWQIGQSYSSSGTFTWTPATGTDAVQVWARRVGSTASYEDWRGTGLFTVAAASPAKMTGLTSSVTFPSAAFAPITWTATATGGSGPLEYKFLLYRSSTNTWMLLQDWSSSNQATWTPGLFNTGQNAVQVWVRTVGSTAAYEDWMGTGYFVVTDSTGLSLTSSVPLSGLRSGMTVTFTGNMAGPGGPYEYEFLIFNGTSWTLAQGYSTTQSFSWTVPSGTLALQIWSRAVGSFTPWERWASTGLFVVNP